MYRNISFSFPLGGRCHLLGPDWPQGSHSRTLQHPRMPQLVRRSLVSGTVVDLRDFIVRSGISVKADRRQCARSN